MRLILLFTIALCLEVRVYAHDPAEFLGAVWQWPADRVPVLDGSLAEWEIVPAELWITHEEGNVQGWDREGAYEGELDPESLSYRWVASFINGEDRLYWAMERSDDDWNLEDNFEPQIDGDHSGGSYWDVVGQTDDEVQRQRGGHAQSYHLYWDNGANLGGDDWNWFWMTQADWYDAPPWSETAYEVTGTPGSGTPWTLSAEWYLTVWDDFNWQSPPESLVHKMTEGEIIGMENVIWDYDGVGGEGCNCTSLWGLNPHIESFGDADFFADFLLVEVQEQLFETAVEENSWGRIKASLTRPH